MSETRRSFRDHPLFQLTPVRFLEFVREPEALFWVFIFPVLLTAGLGLAFRTRAPEQVKVGVLEGPRAAAVAADARRRQAGDREAAQRQRGRAVAPHREDRGPRRCRATSGVTYRFDDTRPDARIARSLADDILQRAAGRADPMPVAEEQVRERGSRYIDFLVPGLLGMNLMGTGIWGVGFAIVDQRRKKLLKRLIATPMSRHTTSRRSACRASSG